MNGKKGLKFGVETWIVLGENQNQFRYGRRKVGEAIVVLPLIFKIPIKT